MIERGEEQQAGHQLNQEDRGGTLGGRASLEAPPPWSKSVINLHLRAEDDSGDWLGVDVQDHCQE